MEPLETGRQVRRDVSPSVQRPTSDGKKNHPASRFFLPDVPLIMSNVQDQGDQDFARRWYPQVRVQRARTQLSVGTILMRRKGIQYLY